MTDLQQELEEAYQIKDFREREIAVATIERKIKQQEQQTQNQ